MDSMRGKNTKRKHLNKTKKKSWRKVNIDDVEDFLEDERLQERTGGKVAEKSDKSLFFVDKKKTNVLHKESKIHRKRKAQDRLTDVEVALKPPPPKKKDKRAANVINKVASGRVSSIQKHAQKQRDTAVQARDTRRVAREQHSLAGYDLWGDKLERENEGEDSHFLEVTRRRRVNAPAHYQDIVSKIPAVEVPHAGASYNPAFDDHQELLLKATVVEVQKVKKEEKLHRALDAQFPYRAPTEESRLAEMSVGLFDDDTEEQEEVGDIDKLSVNPPVRREDKKDERRRKRDKKRKQERKKLKEGKIKRLKDTDNRISRLKAIKKEVKLREMELGLRAEKRAQYKAGHLYRTQKLGKLKYEEPDDALKLSDELRGSLRELKPEGHLLEDRFRSLQKRNIIEPRQMANHKRKYKRKTFERKGHRQITS